MSTAPNDGKEAVILRSLLKDLSKKAEPRQVSTALGRYAGYLSEAKDDRVRLVDEFYQLSLSTEDPCPVSVHTYHWFLCSQKDDCRAVPQYERIRARAPIKVPGSDGALVAELRASKANTALDVYAESCCRLANFLDEICGLGEEAGALFDEGMTVSGVSAFSKGKYAAFLSRNGGKERAEEASTRFKAALAEDGGNAECLVDFALHIAATDTPGAAKLFKTAMEKVPEDARVLAEHAFFLERFEHVPHAALFGKFLPACTTQT
jgi:hypothetical protein